MMRRLLPPLLILLAFIPVGEFPAVAQDDSSDDGAVGVIDIREGFMLPRVGVGGRSPVFVDPVEAALIGGTFAKPQDGQEVQTWKGDTVNWKSAKANAEGWFEDGMLRGGYLYATVECTTDKVMLLNARGHSMVYLNGVPRGGDVYNYGNVHLPVKLRQGVNEFLFLVARGRMRASLEPFDTLRPRFLTSDLTVPSIIAGQAGRSYLGQIPVANPSDEPARVRILQVQPQSSGRSGAVHEIAPLSVRKLPFTIRVDDAPDPGELAFVIQLESKGHTNESAADDSHDFTLDVISPGERRKVTFQSAIDGSVQYYAVLPAKPLHGREDKPGIVLTLHGASVEAFGQARAYRAKSWCHIVAPTNRRPFGFDWEDWGRLDAMEVLEHAQVTLENDPTKVWLTGHSMGGHGAWSVGSHFPDRFAAVGPSAGWESFWSYTGGSGHPERYSVSELLNRSANPSRTLLRKYNFKQQGIYILHGDADDNVPVRESRRMHEQLQEFHTDLAYHEQPGAGHWWDDGHDDGTDCVDWQPMFDTFARRRLPRTDEVTHIDFTTVCPEHNSQCHWLWVQAQVKHLATSRIQMRADPIKRRVVGTTENISRFGLATSDIMLPSDTFTLSIDGQELKDVPWPEHGRLYVTKRDGTWSYSDEHWSYSEKGPHRYGWFKNAYRNRFVYVYGTSGTEPETAANYNKARYDQETWSYRANGGFEIVADSAFDPEDDVDRNIILVGNAENNSAWAKVLGNCPVYIESGKATVGDRTVEGDDLATLFIYPRAGSRTASVGVISGTGAKGVMLTRRIRTFVSGASFPDVIVYGPEMPLKGTGGVRAAGYFDVDWTLRDSELVWNENMEE